MPLIVSATKLIHCIEILCKKKPCTTAVCPNSGSADDKCSTDIVALKLMDLILDIVQLLVQKCNAEKCVFCSLLA